jgi:hypothetical protein
VRIASGWQTRRALRPHARSRSLVPRPAAPAGSLRARSAPAAARARPARPGRCAGRATDDAVALGSASPAIHLRSVVLLPHCRRRGREPLPLPMTKLRSRNNGTLAVTLRFLRLIEPIFVSLERRGSADAVLAKAAHGAHCRKPLWADQRMRRDRYAGTRLVSPATAAAGRRQGRADDGDGNRRSRSPQSSSSSTVLIPRHRAAGKRLRMGAFHPL